MRYFKAQNVTRDVNGVFFEPIETICGCTWGVVAVEDPKEINALASWAAEKKGGVVEITEDEYLDEIKKKSPDLASHHLVTSQLISVKGKGAQVVQPSEDKPAGNIIDVESVAQTAEVKQPEVVAERGKKAKQ